MHAYWGHGNDKREQGLATQVWWQFVYPGAIRGSGAIRAETQAAPDTRMDQQGKRDSSCVGYVVVVGLLHVCVCVCMCVHVCVHVIKCEAARYSPFLFLFPLLWR